MGSYEEKWYNNWSKKDLKKPKTNEVLEEEFEEDLEQEIEDNNERNRMKGIMFTSKAENIDPFLPNGTTTEFTDEEKKILGYGLGSRIDKVPRPKHARTSEQADIQWKRLTREGFDPKKVQYKEYIKNGILSWYDTSSRLREKHEEEMKTWREGKVLTSSIGSIDINRRYVKNTYSNEDKSLNISKEILDGLNTKKVHSNMNRIKWIKRRYKNIYWLGRRLNEVYKHE